MHKLLKINSPYHDTLMLLRSLVPIQYSSSNAPLKRIFQLVLSQGCKTILIEHDFECEDWTSERTVFYADLHKQYSQYAKRLHFFACEIPDEAVGNLANFQNDYLGFCILRPLEFSKVINAVIKPCEDANDPKKSFVICQETFRVEIALEDYETQALTIQGFPFKQQDGQAGCCAHAALSMQDKFLTQRRNHSKGEDNKPHLLEQIVDFISAVPGQGRKTPTSGLLPVEISEALRQMGYYPLVYEFRKDSPPPFPAERIIYLYLESGIPIFLIMPTASTSQRHALTVIGHSFDPDTWWALAGETYFQRRPSGGNYHCSTTWISNFIVHDDNFGPYLTVPVSSIVNAEKAGGLVIAVPLTSNVNMIGEKAELLANYFLSTEIDYDEIQAARSSETINSATFDWFQLLWSHKQRNDLVLRTCLWNSEKFKRSHVSPVLHSYYMSIDMPDYIWVTEISIPEYFCHGRLRFGEIVNDSTALVKTAPPTFLAIHVPGLIKVRNAQTEQVTSSYILDDSPAKHLIR